MVTEMLTSNERELIRQKAPLMARGHSAAQAITDLLNHANAVDQRIAELEEDSCGHNWDRAKWEDCPVCAMKTATACRIEGFEKYIRRLEEERNEAVEEVQNLAGAYIDEEQSVFENIRDERDTVRGKLAVSRLRLVDVDTEFRAYEVEREGEDSVFGELWDRVKATLAIGFGEAGAGVIRAAKAWAAKWWPGPNAQVEEDGCPIGMNPEAWTLIQAVDIMLREETNPKVPNKGKFEALDEPAKTDEEEAELMRQYRAGRDKPQ